MPDNLKNVVRLLHLRCLRYARSEPKLSTVAKVSDDAYFLIVSVVGFRKGRPVAEKIWHVSYATLPDPSTGRPAWSSEYREFHVVSTLDWPINSVYPDVTCRTRSLPVRPPCR